MLSLFQSIHFASDFRQIHTPHYTTKLPAIWEPWAKILKKGRWLDFAGTLCAFAAMKYGGAASCETALLRTVGPFLSILAPMYAGIILGAAREAFPY